MSMQFYGLLRWQEVSSLRWDDLSFHGRVMFVLIRKSKTDQRGFGQTVEIHCHDVETLHCPVYLTRQYAGRLGYDGSGVSGGMQPRMDPAGKGRTSTKICYDTAVKDLRALLVKAGHSASGFTEHSGRRGGATAAAAAGAQWLPLKVHGRWKSDSAAQKYVDEAGASSGMVAAVLAGRKTVGPAVPAVPDIPEVCPDAQPEASPPVAGSAGLQGPATPSTSQQSRFFSPEHAAERARLLAAGFTENWSEPDRVILYPPGWNM